MALRTRMMEERERALFPRAAGRATGGLDLRCVIFARRGDRILLVRHRRHPVYESSWTLPGGTLEYGRNPRDSAARILQDQACVLPETMRLLGVQSSIEGDWVLTFQFEAAVAGDPTPGAGIAEVRLAPFAGGPAMDLHAAARTDLERYWIHEIAKTG